jgi:hypothetical protein
VVTVICNLDRMKVCGSGGDTVEGKSRRAPFDGNSDEKTQSHDRVESSRAFRFSELRSDFQNIMDNKLLTIAVDFDGVIADYDDWKGNENLGSPRQDVIEALRILRSEGWKIVVYSTRGTDEIAPYLIDNDVPFDEINQNSSYQTRGVKPVATIYWDDRACRYSGDARKDLQAILEFRTWNGRR